MRVNISGRSYTFSADVLSKQNTRNGYFELANIIFELELNRWYGLGFWDSTFIPYVLYDGDTAVSSVAVCINEVLWQNAKKIYVQISTFMTLPDYRKKGLNRWLMECVLNEWADKCDAIYLLANDSVVNYYPKFGFEEFTEYDFTVPLHKTEGAARKLNLGDSNDLSLIVRKYDALNPFAKLKVINISEFLFHCVNFQSDNVYYHESADAVVIIKHEKNKLICYDILTEYEGQLNDILGVFANEDTKFACLGFTPEITENCSVAESQEENNHLFVLPGKENIFKDFRVKFPLLSRA